MKNLLIGLVAALFISGCVMRVHHIEEPIVVEKRVYVPKYVPKYVYKTKTKYVPKYVYKTKTKYVPYYVAKKKIGPKYKYKKYYYPKKKKVIIRYY
jgi:hypothetical protein